MSGGSSRCWEFGHVKAELRASAVLGLFKATWYMADFSENDNCIISFDGATMNVILSGGKSVYLKMYPQGSTSSSNNETEKWSGTGWALGNGYLVTNHHVTDGARTIKVKGVDGDINTGYTAEVVASDKVNDISILKITDRNFIGFGARPYGVTTRMADVGEDVFVLGYPLTQALGNEIKLTNGIISSRTGYQGDVACYQMSAPVQPGNSGGPMFDSKGNIIGIVVAGVPGAENVGYAIKTSYLKILIESAGLNITFPSNNTISTLSLAEKVKRVKNFVFYIECSK
jgi:S1-C subfamily serine protease